MHVMAPARTQTTTNLNKAYRLLVVIVLSKQFLSCVLSTMWCVELSTRISKILDAVFKLTGRNLSIPYAQLLV